MLRRIVLFYLLLSLPQLHAEDDLDYLFSMSFEQLMQLKITGSTLTPEDIRSVPAAVSVFNHEQIKRMGLDTLDELMNIVPGFQSYRSSFSAINYVFSSRGRRIGDPAAEVLIMVDGQRLEEPATGGSAQVIPKFPLMVIEQVEFIRGPGAAIYGSNAMMGVINITTRSEARELSGSYGTFNRRQMYLLGSQKVNDMSLDVYAHTEIDDGDNFKVQDTFGVEHINTDDPRKITNLNLKLNWQDTYINLQHNQFDSDNFYIIDLLSNGFNSFSSKLSSIALKQEFTWQSVSSWFLLSYNRSEFEINLQGTPEGALLAASGGASNDEGLINIHFKNFTEVRTQWHNDLNINDRSSLQWGIELRHIDTPETIAKGNFGFDELAKGDFPIPYYGSLEPDTLIQEKSKRDVVGLYSQYLSQLLKDTHLTFGLRYDHFSGVGDQLSPRVGIVQSLNENHSLKLLYGKSFRAPTDTELHLVNNTDILGNPDLKPETVQSWELIWVAQWVHTALSLGYFENHFEDAIAKVSTGVSTSTGDPLRFENTTQDPVKGLELELSHELNEHWLLRTTLTHINEKPDESFREADQLASFMINYQHEKWNANLISYFHSDRKMATGGINNERLSLPGYWQFMGKIDYQLTSDWQGYLQIKNISDKNFLTPTSGIDLNEGVPNRGREILAGVNWNF